MAASRVHLFGIRHHGPGSARSVLHALQSLDPDIVLIEGPPDADAIVPLAAHAGLRPPVAILVYVPEHPERAVWYPFAEYSPEWQAIRFALSGNRPVRFIDLPQSVRLARPAQDSFDDEPASADPLAALAAAAGFSDTERWWDRLVESRQGDDDSVFAAIHEMMAAVRTDLPGDAPRAELLREAHMRRSIRAAQAEGFERIAVVCGAYHTPALDIPRRARDDDALLKGLAKVKTAASWVPWSYEGLARASGYGAGIESPVWYELLWTSRQSLGPRWMTRAARLLRDEDLPVSSAHVIEACRLAEALSAVRGHPLPGLPEYADAAVAVLGAGESLPLDVIGRRWHFDARLGQVPSEFPAAPLQQDLAALQKQLRLPSRLEAKVHELDLRTPMDRARSHLLRRLRVLRIDWGVPEEGPRHARGTFHERWQLQWRPEFVVALIESSRYGHTIEQAAGHRIIELASGAGSLEDLAALLQDALFADLGPAVPALVTAIESRAALASDVRQLLDALPPLAEVRRYGNVRETGTALVEHVLAGLVPRVLIGLDPASAGIDDDAARELWTRLVRLNGALRLLDDAGFLREWHLALERLAQRDRTHPLIAGYAHRLLYDAGELPFEALEPALSRALSPGHAPASAAVWVEGLLAGSGMLLVHDGRLRGLIDSWIRSVPEEHFVQALPLLRRTFAEFAPAERRNIGEQLRAAARGHGTQPDAAADTFDETAALRVLPVLATIWGTEGPRE